MRAKSKDPTPSVWVVGYQPFSVGAIHLSGIQATFTKADPAQNQPTGTQKVDLLACVTAKQVKALALTIEVFLPGKDSKPIWCSSSDAKDIDGVAPVGIPGNWIPYDLSSVVLKLTVSQTLTSPEQTLCPI
jgi:hypothetical protein